MPGTALHLCISRCANRYKKKREEKQNEKKNPSTDRQRANNTASCSQTNWAEELAYNDKQRLAPVKKKKGEPYETKSLAQQEKDDAAAGLDRVLGIGSESRNKQGKKKDLDGFFSSLVAEKRVGESREIRFEAKIYTRKIKRMDGAVPSRQAIDWRG